MHFCPFGSTGFEAIVTGSQKGQVKGNKRGNDISGVFGFMFATVDEK